jgi:hypothetical protein
VNLTETGAAVGRFQQAALLLARVGERAALVTEQLAFQQLLGQRRAGMFTNGLAARLLL